MAGSPRWRRGGLALGVVVAGVLVGCSAVTPPPLIPMHAGTAPHPIDATTVTVVVGGAGELFGGVGWGLALRGERQVEDGAAVGIQLGGGRGQEGEGDHGPPPRHWLIEVRGYGRLVSPAHDWVAGLGSVGVTAMDTGLIATTLAIGSALSYPNDHLVPALGAFAAVSKPWRRGRGFGAGHDRHVATTWWLGLSGAVIAPIGDTGHAPSLEVGMAFGEGGHDSSQAAVSLADGYTF